MHVTQMHAAQIKYCKILEEGKGSQLRYKDVSFKLILLELEDCTCFAHNSKSLDV